MFIAEKKVEIPVVEVRIADGDHRTAEFLAKNPLGQVPVLELESGLCISESMAICRYLEEAFPEPSLFGRDAKERAIIHMWSRRVEAMLFVPAVELGHHSHPSFREQFNQVPAYAELCRASIKRAYSLLDSRLASVGFVGGDAFSVADLVAFCGVEVARIWQAAPDSSFTSLERWHQSILKRPSASIARYA
jgi:glutathione S-transferase